jgi:hypothetical protein
MPIHSYVNKKKSKYYVIWVSSARGSLVIKIGPPPPNSECLKFTLWCVLKFIPHINGCGCGLPYWKYLNDFLYIINSKNIELKKCLDFRIRIRFCVICQLYKFHPNPINIQNKKKANFMLQLLMVGTNQREHSCLHLNYKI